MTELVLSNNDDSSKNMDEKQKMILTTTDSLYLQLVSKGAEGLEDAQK